MTFSVLTIQKYIRGWMVRKNSQDLKNVNNPLITNYNKNYNQLENMNKKNILNGMQCLNKCSSEENEKFNKISK